VFNQLRKAGCLEITHTPTKLPIPDDRDCYFIMGYRHDDPNTITHL